MTKSREQSIEVQLPDGADPSACFAIEVTAAKHKHLGLRVGDIVVAQRRASVARGDLVVYQRGGEVSFRRYFSPNQPTLRDCRICGRAIRVVRHLPVGKTV
jgi:SOS-response transcriptional repressor LexA